MRKGAKLRVDRNLRRTETLAEKRLWEQLRNRTLDGLKFVRQAPFGPDVIDFLNREHQFIIETDGATHSTDAEVIYDSRRTAFLAVESYRVIRFQNDEILNGMDEVLTLIIDVLQNLPRPQNGRGQGPGAKRWER